MSLRIVLNAEGARETRGELASRRAPGDPLSDDELGPGHVLVRRVAEVARGVPEAAISFVEPLRSARGLPVRGSGLLEKTTLRQLLQWASTRRRPDLAIVLVDADGDSGRKSVLAAHIEGINLPTVIAVAVQEFESWLLADQAALNAAIETSPPKPPAIEGMSPGEAKRRLAELLAACDDPHAKRLQLAKTIALDRLSQECASFAAFRDEMSLRTPRASR